MSVNAAFNRTVRDLLRRAVQFLKENNIPDPEKEALFLASHLLGCKPAELFLRRSEVVDDEEMKTFMEMTSRRGKREPSQYITGEQEFMGLTLKVTPDVLIPRPETELLAEEGLKIVSSIGSEEGSLKVLDLCTGSGCIVISLAKEFQGARYYAADFSGAALDVARANAEAHGVEERVEFLEGDLFTPLKGLKLVSSFDLIVSNPPYVARADMEGLAPEIRLFEPERALCAGEDGLDFIRRIISESPVFLKPGGHIILEIGCGQAEAVKKLLKESRKFTSIEIKKDYSRIDRIVKARLGETLL